jgi:hypothetical protein
MEDLPELPEMECLGGGENFSCYGFTADQMREYARKAVLAERERCAKLAEVPQVVAHFKKDDPAAEMLTTLLGQYFGGVAAAIRSSGGN